VNDNLYLLHNKKQKKYYALAILENSVGFFRVLRTIIFEDGTVFGDGLIPRVFSDFGAAERYCVTLGMRKKARKGYEDIDVVSYVSDEVAAWVEKTGKNISSVQEDAAKKVIQTNQQYVVQVDDNSDMERLYGKGVTYIAEKVPALRGYMSVYDNFGDRHRLAVSRLSNIERIKPSLIANEVFDESS
jgi:hypothetical protein